MWPGLKILREKWENRRHGGVQSVQGCNGKAPKEDLRVEQARVAEENKNMPRVKHTSRGGIKGEKRGGRKNGTPVLRERERERERRALCICKTVLLTPSKGKINNSLRHHKTKKINKKLVLVAPHPSKKMQIS